MSTLTSTPVGCLAFGPSGVPSPLAVAYAASTLNGFVHGIWHPDLKTPFQLSAWFTNSARLVMHLNSVSDGSILVVRADGTNCAPTSLTSTAVIASTRIQPGHPGQFARRVPHYQYHQCRQRLVFSGLGPVEPYRPRLFGQLAALSGRHWVERTARVLALCDGARGLVPGQCHQRRPAPRACRNRHFDQLAFRTLGRGVV